MESTQKKESFLTAVPAGKEPDHSAAASHTEYDSETESFEGTEQVEEEEKSYFHVEDAIPPTNYNDPYSTLPPKIKLGQIIVTDFPSNLRVARRDQFGNLQKHQK